MRSGTIRQNDWGVLEMLQSTDGYIDGYGTISWMWGGWIKAIDPSILVKLCGIYLKCRKGSSTPLSFIKKANCYLGNSNSSWEVGIIIQRSST